jgi:hypothetical protein
MTSTNPNERHIGSVPVPKCLLRSEYMWTPDLERDERMRPGEGELVTEYAHRVGPLLNPPRRVQDFRPDPNRPVRRTSRLNACVASAVAAAIKLNLESRRPGIECEPSVPFIYYYGRYLQLQERENVGLSIFNALKACFFVGFCEDADWRLTTELKASDQPSLDAIVAAHHRGVAKFEHIDKLAWHDHFLEAVKQAIIERHAVIFWIAVEDDFVSRKLESDEVIHPPSPYDPSRLTSRHCLLAEAYDDKRGCIWARDSVWPARGRDGYLPVSYDYITGEQFSNDFWVITQVVVDGDEEYQPYDKKRARRLARAQAFASLTTEVYINDMVRRLNAVKARAPASGATPAPPPLPVKTSPRGMGPGLSSGCS